MKKILIIICWLFLVIFIPARAFAWGVATHAYFAKELAKKFGVVNLPEMIYGAMLPDLFNLKFDLDYKDQLRDQTHYDFMKVMDNARGTRQWAYAFGFVSHNDAWGADYTAHHDGRTTPGKGYVITKVEILKPELVSQIQDILINAGISEALALPLVEELAPGLTELFVETAVDLMIKRNEDPEIGASILLSARFNDFEVDSLLVAAYAEDFAGKFDLTIMEAGELIINAEKEYRELITLHGGIFVKDEPEAIELLADLGVIITEATLEAKLGFNVTVPPETDEVFKRFLLDHAIPSVEGDYATEVSATLAYLEEQLLPVGVEEETPVAYSLYIAPNPFNPVTTITYVMGKAGNVTLEVYNVTGQKVATILNGNCDKGSYTVMWNASGFASGVYFAVMRAEDFKKTAKMMLVK